MKRIDPELGKLPFAIQFDPHEATQIFLDLSDYNMDQVARPASVRLIALLEKYINEK